MGIIEGKTSVARAAFIVGTNRTTTDHGFAADLDLIGGPVPAGENEYTRYGFRELIENRCVDILQPDAQIMGGITEFMKVAAMAQSHDLTIAPHGNQEVHVQLVAAIPNGLTVEFYRGSTDLMWGQMFEDTLMIEDGYVLPSERPARWHGSTSTCLESLQNTNAGSGDRRVAPAQGFP